MQIGNTLYHGVATVDIRLTIYKSTEKMIKACCKGFNANYADDAPTYDDVATLSGDTILEFGAPWCQHCQFAHNLLKQTLEDHAIFNHIKVYDGKGKQLGRQFKVKLWPTLIKLRDGKEVARLVRPVTVQALNQFINTATDSEL